MLVTDGIIKINLSTTSPYPVTYKWTVSQTGTVSGAVAGTGNVINQNVSGTGTVIYSVTAIEIATGCEGETVEIIVTVKEQLTPKWIIDDSFSYCEQGDAPDKIFDSLTTKSVTRETNQGTSIVTLDNSNVIQNTLDGISIINLNTLTESTIFTAQENGTFSIEVDFTGSASVTKNAGFFTEFKFFIQINGTNVPLAPNTINPVTGNTCQFYLTSPAGSGTRTGSTPYNGNYVNSNLNLNTGQTIKLYVETFTSVTGASTVPLTMNINNFKVNIKQDTKDNTGYRIQPKLKKVTNDSNEFPLDVNNELSSVTGLPQDTMDNPISSLTYKLYNPTLCPVDHTPDNFTFTPKTEANLSTSYDSNIVNINGITMAAPISIVDGEYRINGGSWLNTIGTINNGDTVQVRRVSSSSYNTLVATVLTVGTYSTAFNITTKSDDTPVPFTFTPVTNAELSTNYDSNTITIAGL